VVGDRGMIAEAGDQTSRSRLHHRAARSAIRKLVEAGDLQVSLDDRKLAEITWPDYPNERLVVYRNPVLAGERTRRRGELLDALDDIEQKLRDIQTRVRPDNKPLRGQDAIGIAVGRVIKYYNMTFDAIFGSVP
jgi:hypothetical protein